MGSPWPNLNTLRISKLFVSAPRKKRYCLEITKELKMPEETVRDQLKTMTNHKWLESERESPQPWLVGKRPELRVLYSMTNYGVDTAIALLQTVQLQGTIIAPSS